MPENSIFYKKAAAYLPVFFILLTLFIFALNAYPVLGGDSIYYVPPAINHKLGQGLINQLSGIFLTGDLSGSGKFLVFPPLFPLVLSWLMPVGTSNGAYIAMFLLYAATILAAGFVYRKLLIPDWSQAGWYRIAIYVFSIFSLAAILISYPGRPETLARLLMTLALIGLLYPKKNWLSIFFGVILGLSLATHPGPAILFAPIIGVFFAFHHPTKKSLKLIFFSLAISLIVFFLITQIFSYGFLPTVIGVFHQFSRLNTNLNPGEYLASGQPSVFAHPFSVTGDTLGGIIDQFIVSKGTPFHGLVFVFSVLCLLPFYRRFRNRVVAPVLFCLSVIATGIVFLFFVYKQNFGYVSALTPIFILIVAYYSVNLTSSKILRFVAIALIVLSSLMFFDRLILFPFYLESGLSLNQARVIFENLHFGSNQLIGVDATMWPISENYSRMHLAGHPEDIEYPTSTFIMRENFNGWTELPSKWSYCRLVKDFFTHKAPVLFGIKLSNAVPGYAFNVYDCATSSVANK